MTWIALVFACALSAPPAPSIELNQALKALRQVGPNGKGKEAASVAWRVVAHADAADLPTILAGMDNASPLAHNWIRSALDTVLDRVQHGKETLPAKQLIRFLLDRQHDPQARRLAFELLTAGNSTARDHFLEQMLDDPSPELRHDALALVLGRADKLLSAGKKTEALFLYQQALAAARERGQLDKAAQGLRTLGHSVDLAAHLGMVRTWKLIGPFADPQEKGLDTVYPPEQHIDLTATYDGKAGKVQWKDYVTHDPYGKVDVKAGLKDEPASVAYALATVSSPTAKDVQIRIGCYNAFKLWVNGALVLDRRDAFTGMSLDHYIASAHLKAGANRILVKLCREDAPAPVPALCQFLLRLTDETGKAIRPDDSRQHAAAPAGK